MPMDAVHVALRRPTGVHAASMLTSTKRPIDRFALARVRHALRLAGLPCPDELVPASSTRNEVFIAGDAVVRINRQPNQRLRREALLCAQLPLRDWTPRVLASGDELGADYLIVAKRPGTPLSRAWPLMNPQQRRESIRQLAEALATLHATPRPSSLPRLERTTHLLDAACTSPAVPLVMAIDELKGNRAIDTGLLRAVDRRVTELSDAIRPYDASHLIHGDLTFENVLWDGSRITALLDLEWCRGAPADLDLDVLFRFCAVPSAHVAPDYARSARAEDYRDVPVWFAEHLPHLFQHPRLRDRLTLYSLAYDVNELVSFPPEPGDAKGDPLHPTHRLAAMLNGGGHVAKTLDRIGLPTT